MIAAPVGRDGNRLTPTPTPAAAPAASPTPPVPHSLPPTAQSNPRSAPHSVPASGSARPQSLQALRRPLILPHHHQSCRLGVRAKPALRLDLPAMRREPPGKVRGAACRRRPRRIRCKIFSRYPAIAAPNALSLANGGSCAHRSASRPRPRSENAFTGASSSHWHGVAGFACGCHLLASTWPGSWPNR